MESSQGQTLYLQTKPVGIHLTSFSFCLCKFSVNFAIAKKLLAILRVELLMPKLQ
jgi:hypothetical protein